MAAKKDPLKTQELEEPKETGAAEPAARREAPAIDLLTVNQFRALTAPCLVCGRMRPGIAYGITPEQAVCADDYADRPDETQAALEAAARGETPRRRGGTR